MIVFIISILNASRHHDPALRGEAGQAIGEGRRCRRRRRWGGRALTGVLLLPEDFPTFPEAHRRISCLIVLKYRVSRRWSHIDRASYRCLWRGHSSGEEDRLENQLWKHQISGWIAISAAGSHGQGSSKRSGLFTDTGIYRGCSMYAFFCASSALRLMRQRRAWACASGPLQCCGIYHR